MSRFRVLLLGLLALPALCLLVGAEPRKGKKYALLVGVTKYDHADLRKLRYTENDVEGLAKVLSAGGGFDEVRVLTESRAGLQEGKAPTAANVRAALKELFKGKTGNDVVLVALAGHGVQLNVSDPDGKGPDKTFSCFCPSDAQLNDTDYKSGKSPTLINLDEMMKQLGECGAGAKLLLVDACRNDVKQDRSLDIGKVSVPKNVLALFSCSSGQKAYETPKLGKGHGVFFYHVIEALTGKEREVTWEAMAVHVRKRVPLWVEKEIRDGARQTPHSLHNVSGEPVVLVASGKVPRATVMNSVGMELVEIAAGEFDMGAPIDEKGGRATERPSHPVRISRGFFLGATEVTQAQYLAVMKSNPSAFAAGGDAEAVVKGINTDHHPVEKVTYADAVAFCEKLSGLAGEKKAKRTYRLPSEAEWEYACRAGSNTAFHTGDRLAESQANFANSPGHTLSVKKYRPNRWGLYGMHGNVREWVADWHSGNYYENSPKDDPQGPADGKRKVVRGGSWADAARACRSAARELASPTHRDSETGFRVVMELRR